MHAGVNAADILNVFEGNGKETFEGSETVHLLGVGPTTYTDNVSKHRAI